MKIVSTTIAIAIVVTTEILANFCIPLMYFSLSRESILKIKDKSKVIFSSKKNLLYRLPLPQNH